MVEIRFITEDDVNDYRQALAFGFGDDLDDEPDGDERFLALNNVDTTMVAVDRDRMVATFSAYDLDLTVPGGGSIATAGTTHVTVHPTHRRRGVLTGMMLKHLEQAVERGQLMAALWASEERIYGRFGYGVACYGSEMQIPSRTIDLPPGPTDVDVRPLTESEARVELPAVFQRALPTTPGLFARTEAWWEHRHLRETPHTAAGASRRRFVLAERNGDTIGYVTYRQRRAESDFEEGRTQIVELVALDDDGRRALWHFVTNVDLYRLVEWWNAPVDDPIFREADRFRSIKQVERDTMWLRPLDVPRIIEARRYERDGALVVNVLDPLLGRGGRFRLEVAEGRAHCTPTSDRADLELDVASLGAAYLGATPIHALARAGRVSGSVDAVQMMTDVFRTTGQPFCIEVF